MIKQTILVHMNNLLGAEDTGARLAIDLEF